MKKRLSIILVALFMAILLPNQVKAAQNTKEVEISQPLSDWIVDEATNTIYGLSISEKSLLFIDATTLEEQETLYLGLEPVDMIKDDNMIYISLKSTKKVLIVDTQKKKIIGNIRPTNEILNMVKVGKKLYYTSNYDLYVYDLIEETDTKLTSLPQRQTELAYDSEQELLYLAGQGTTGSNMYYYSIKEKKVVSKTNYDKNYGFWFPDKGVRFDGTHVYYASRQFDKSDATRFTGDYGKNDDILYVTDDLVYSTTSVYNKETHAKLGDYQKEAKLVWGNDTTVLQYTKYEGTIKRSSSNGEKITANTIFDVIDGKKSPQLQENTQSKKPLKGVATLEMNSKLDKLVLDERENVLLACSNKNKALFFINAATLDLEKTMQFKSYPTDLLIEDGYLYVAFADAHYILVIDFKKREIVDTLYTTSEPYQIVKEGKNIYYTEESQHCGVYKYSLESKTDKRLLSAYYPVLAINKEDHILYVGESHSSGSNLYYYSTSREELIGKSDYDNGYGFWYPERQIEFDGEYVYYADYVINKLDPTDLIEEYYMGEAEDDYIYEFSENGIMYVYADDENTISKIDYSNIAFVYFDSQGGSEIETQIADIGALIQSPKAPGKYGSTFAGWYREETCKTPWDFNLDTVQESMLLYAKWILNPAAPSVSYVKQTSLTSMEISWNEVKGASGYEIYRASSNNGDYKLVGTLSETNYIDKDVKVNQNYYYKVKAYKEDKGMYAYGEFSKVCSGKTTLQTPVQIQAEAISTDQIKVSWEAVSDAAGYEIYQSTQAAGAYTLIDTIIGHEYMVSGLQDNTAYYYKVRAYVMDGSEKVFSQTTTVVTATTNKKPIATKPPVTTKPSTTPKPTVKPSPVAPLKQVSSLKVTSASYNSVKLTWSTVGGAAGYEIYEATSQNGKYKRVGTTNARSYTQKGIQTGAKRYYKVRAYRMNGTKKEFGAYSKVSNGAAKLSTPIKLKVQKVNATSTKVTWNKVSGASGYEIYRSTSKNGTYKKVKTQNGTSYKNTKLKKKQTYYYKVRAYRVVTNKGKKVYSSYSKVVSIKM
ncbi:MAG: InlB B-repeat-containing protein [bacterium]|nr:InlB B-repeat-containing protein [bacterium]